MRRAKDLKPKRSSLEPSTSGSKHVRRETIDWEHWIVQLVGASQPPDSECTPRKHIVVGRQRDLVKGTFLRRIGSRFGPERLDGP
jgi:hypothetical protein